MVHGHYTKYEQALTKANPCMMRLVAMSNKCEFNIATMANVTCCDMKPNMHQAFMVNGHYTKYE